MPVTAFNLTNSQGRTITVDDVGSRVTFGREIRKFILAFPAGMADVYCTIGKAGLLEDADSTKAHLDATYPRFQATDVFEFVQGDRQPRTLEFRCATGILAADVRVILI